MTQGERIKEIRKSQKMTLEQFGARLGVTKQTVSRLENGVNNVTEQMVKSICREFNVNYDFLIYGDGDMFESLPATAVDELCEQYGCDTLDRSLIETYVNLPENDRNVIKSYLKKVFLKDLID